MVTQVSDKTKETAEKEVARLKAENERLKSGITDIVQGRAFMENNGDGTKGKRLLLKLFMVDPRTEFPIKSGTYEGNDGKQHPEYATGKWLWMDESELYLVVSGEAKSARIYYSKTNRKVGSK